MKVTGGDLSYAQRLLLARLRATGGTYLYGASVRVGQALQRRGLATVEDLGDVCPDGRSDRQRWWATPTPGGAPEPE